MTDPATPEEPKEFVDLHLHTTASDGTQPPFEVVQAAVRVGLQAIAVTDHDTVRGVSPARMAAVATELHVIAGTELSAYQGDDEVHVLGLHLHDLGSMDLRLETFRQARRDRAAAIVKKLQAIGVNIKLEDVLDAAKGESIGRPHVAKALVDNGWAQDTRDAFDRYLGLGRPAYMDKRRLSLKDAINMIHDCGGIAVLAHPGGHGSLTRLTALKELGLDGVEVLHPSHSADDRRSLLEVARQLDLIPSGGSDWHGAPDGPRTIGCMRVPKDWLPRQIERAEVYQRRRALL